MSECSHNILETFYQGHEYSWEQGFKKGLSLTFKPKKKKKTRLFNSKTITKELKTRTQDVQDKCEKYVYYVNMCKHEHKKNMIRVWCKIVLKTNVEQIEENGGFISIYSPLGI